MNQSLPGSGDRLSRRSLLTSGAAALAVSTSGCVRQVRSAVNRTGLDPLSLTITTLPADGDRESVQLARRIAQSLETVGIDVSIELRSHEEFLRAVLINHDFDVYVGRHPGATDPDFLYEALHSRYAEESGWQNPFGYTNFLVDDHLEAQRAVDGDDRRDAVTAMLEAVATEQPFVPLCVPDEHRIVRTDRFDGWEEGHLATRLGYLGLEPLASDELLRGVVIDARPSENLNPLSAEYRNRGLFIDLLYDSLATEVPFGGEEQGSILNENVTQEDGSSRDLDGSNAETSTEDDVGTQRVPWLARSWEWNGTALEVTLREGCTFHDGEPLTASDVEFTYEFLADTTLGRRDPPAPAPRYRGLVSAVDDVAVDGEYDLSFEIATSREVGERALSVPILPTHVWEDRSDQVTVRGVEVAPGTTEALVTDNVPAIGSGPFAFESRTERDRLTLERFDDHFTTRPSVDLPEPTVERFRSEIDPRSTSAIEFVTNGDADVTTSTLETYTIDAVPDTEGVSLVKSPSWTFYHLGFNARRSPFSNPHFRRTVARLLDKSWLVDALFDGYARPVATPVTGNWIPDTLAWNGSDPEVPFLGTDGTGEFDAEVARAAFEAVGFHYDDEGRLLVRR